MLGTGVRNSGLNPTIIVMDTAGEAVNLNKQDFFYKDSNSKF